MTYQYKTKGTCSQYMIFDLSDDEQKTITHIDIIGGCNGNLKGIMSLVSGMSAYEVIEKLAGIHCGTKHTSCPDQLATALKQALAMEQEPAQ